MTAQDNRTMANTLKMKEGLRKMREDMLKAYSIGRNIRVNEKLKEWGLFPMAMTWMIEDGHVKEYEIPEQTGKGLGRRLQWNYTGNTDGIVDQALIEYLQKRTKKYDAERRAKKKLEQESGQINKREEKATLKKLPASNETTIESILIWIEEEFTKEDLIPGYLRPVTKVMYQRTKDVLSNIKPSIDRLKEVLNEIHI